MHAALTRRFRTLPRRLALVLSLLALIGQVAPGAVGPAQAASTGLLAALAAASVDCAGIPPALPHAPKPLPPRAMLLCPLAAALAAPGALPAAAAPSLPCPRAIADAPPITLPPPRAPPPRPPGPAAPRAPPAFV